MSSLQQLLVFGLVVFLLVMVYLLQPILMPFLVGIAIGYMGDPLVDRLETWRLNRTMAVVVVFLFLSLVLVGVLLIILPMIVRELGTLIGNIPDMLIWLKLTMGPTLLDLFGVNPFDVRLDSIKSTLSQHWLQAGGLASQLISEITRSSMALALWITNLGLIPIVAFYLMRDWDILVARLRKLLPRQHENRVVGLVSACDEVLSAFIRGQLMVMLILGGIYAAGLWLVGLEMAILLGLLAGLASIVPYLGFIIGILAAGTAAAFQFQEVMPLFYVAAVFGAGQLLESFVLTPVLVGDRIGLHPVAVIFAIMAGGQLFGFVGVLLALPVAAVIMVFVRDFHTSWLASEYYGQQEGTGEGVQEGQQAKLEGEDRGAQKETREVAQEQALDETSGEEQGVVAQDGEESSGSGTTQND
ncbi:MAG: AI-2E family transporter [Gammaproteobacteria bacterium]|nr:AI-2E family transporter [Gammaproteobacteria bacterium]